MKLMTSLLTGVLLCAAGATTSFGQVITKAVNYEQGGVKCVGYLAYDPIFLARFSERGDDTFVKQHASSHSEKAPGVLIVPEWWGVTDFVKNRAREVAKLGYVAFVADMYGDGQTTFDAKQAGALAMPFYGKPVMAERAQAALDALLKTGFVETKKVASIGFCFGGSTSMALAESGAPLAAVVSFHGGPIPPTPEQSAQIKAPILILNGAADPMVPADKLGELVSGWKKSGQSVELVNYPGALHAFTNPDADKLAEKNGMVGKIGYNESAAQKSWLAMKAFLKTHLGK